MSQVSRRTAIGSVAASLIAPAAVGGVRSPSPFAVASGPMTLAEFRSLNGRKAVSDLLGHLSCGTLSSCHEKMREEHGLWIPELVPVFERLDAMADGASPDGAGERV